MKKFISILITCLLLGIINKALSQTAGDFRSRQTGAWEDFTSWQTYNGNSWINATISPSSSNGKITILSTHIITASTNIAADQVIINRGGTLNIKSGIFTVTDASGVDVDCSGTLALSSGTLNGAGSVRFASGSTFNWTGGTLAGSGNITVNTGALLSMTGTTHYVSDTKAIANSGIWTWTGGTLYYNNSSSLISNAGTFNIYTDDDVSGYNSSGASFVNRPGGIINKIGSPYDETYFYNISSFTNSGTVNVNSSRIRFYTNAVDSGTINIGLGAQVNFTGGNAVFTSKAILQGDGSLNCDGAIILSSTPSVLVNNIDISHGAFTLTSSINRTNGSIFNVDGGTLNGTGSLKFASGSTFNWTGGTIGGSGTLNINSGGTFNMYTGAHYLSDTRSINNSGTWTWTEGPLIYSNSSSVITNAGIFNINTDQDITGSNSINTSFINKKGGIINKIGSPSDETYFYSIGQFANSGTMNVNSGRMRFYVSSADSGLINVAVGSQINYSNGIAKFSALTVIKGAGTINFDGAIDTIKTTSVPINNINVSAGMLTLMPSLSRSSGSTFNLYGGTLNGTGSLNFNSGSTFHWDGGLIGGSGSITLNGGSTFAATGGYHYLSDTKSINNSGNWTWTGGPLYYYNSSSSINNSGTLNINTDDDIIGNGNSTTSFNNKPTGVINKFGSPDNETSFSGFSSFINQGKINITSGKINVATDTSVYTNVLNAATGTTFRLTGKLANFNNGSSFTGKGTINLDAGTFQFNTPVSLSTNTMNLGGGYLKGDSTLTFNTGSIFNWTAGTLGGGGSLNIDSGASFNMSEATHYLSDSRAINNSGTWAWTNGDLYFYNGINSPISNAGTFNINTDADTYDYPLNIGSFTNQATGIINKTGLPSEQTALNGFSAFNNKGRVNINSGNLTINVPGIHSGMYGIATGAQLRGSINMIFTGSTFSNYGIVTLNELNFGKTTSQTLSGTGSINTLTVNNTGGITLGGSQTINNGLNLIKGKMTLNSKNLMIGSAAQLFGGSPVSYVVTNGTGSLQRNVLNDSATVLFAIGTAEDYMPVLLQLSKASIPDTFKVRVLPNLYAAYDASGNPMGSALTGNLVNGTWLISEKINGGSHLTITPKWNGSNESAGFKRANSSFGHFINNTWVTDTTKDATGSNPYTVSKTNISAFPVFGVFNQFVSGLNTYAQLCRGDTVSIPYKAIGKFSSGNKFTAQLSDSGGSFAAPVNIGSVTSSVSGNIYATIPASATPASGYRIRVNSSSPSLISTDNASDIIISSCSDVQKISIADLASNAPIPGFLINNISVFPNPTDGLFTITLHFKEEKTGQANLEIMTTAGDHIYSYKIPVSGYQMQKTISLPSSISPGIYMLRVIIGKDVFYGKIVCRRKF